MWRALQRGSTQAIGLFEGYWIYISIQSAIDMSWILGFMGTSLSPTLRERLVAVQDTLFNEEGTVRHHVEGARYYVAVGGIEETLRFGSFLDQPDAGFAVVGLGIHRHDDHCTFLNTAAWHDVVASPRPKLDSLDGHFVAVRWNAERIECFTDVLGVRTLYLATLPEGTVFSTRLDWLTTVRGDASLDVEAFGTHWLTFNQLSTDSLIRGIQRLGPGGVALIKPTGVTTKEQLWTPRMDERDSDGSAFARTLTALTHPRPSDRRTVSLGLSGGLDSRLLLALGLREEHFATHTFGPETHPDVRIAHRIAASEGIPLQHLHKPVPDAEACLALLRQQVAQTQAVSAASSVLGLRYYPTLHAQHRVMIDGGLGEAARRQLMNRLLRQGRSALRSGDPAAILPYIRIARADIFTREATALMETGARHQLDMLWSRLPDSQEVHLENRLDLLGVWTRLPNFFGFEQNRLDGVILNYMPFAQPSLLRAVFQVPVSLRRNGQLFRRLIRSRRPSLARHPLVKGHITYPFAFPTLPAYAWTTIKKKAGMGYVDQRPSHFLSQVKAFALDAVHSTSVRTYALYDHPRLVHLIERYYAGEHTLATQVDWWLAFEMWRQVLGIG